MQSWKSTALASVQLAVIAYLVVTAPWRLMSPWLLGVAGVGLAIGLWAVATMGLRRLRVRPEPHPDAVLLTSGPYRYVRHPMYTAVVLVAVAALCADWRSDRIVMGVLLAVVLTLKIRMEERMLAENFLDYGSYTKRTGAIVPKVRGMKDEG